MSLYIYIYIYIYINSQFTGQQGKEEALNHFHPVNRHLDISRVITAGSSPLHIGSSRTRTGNLRKSLTITLHALNDRLMKTVDNCIYFATIMCKLENGSIAF